MHRYCEAKDLFVDLLASVDPLATVPACPAWDVHDLLAHQVHQLAGACDGTFPVSDALVAISAEDGEDRRVAARRQARWIDEGMATWRERGMAELCEAWGRLADDAPDAALDGLLPDIAVHLFDLTGVAGSRAHRDHPLVIEAVRFWAGPADARLRHAGFGGLRVALDDGTTIEGASDAVTATGNAFEVLRALTGRRSRDQVARLVPDGLPGAAIDAVPAYGCRATPLEE